MSPHRKGAAFAALLLDLDGTLLDTVPDLAAAANRLLASLERPPVTVETISTFVGRGIGRLVERVLLGGMDGRVDTAALGAAQTRFESYYAEESGRLSKAYPGVMAALERLRHAGIPMGVVTNKAEAFTRPLLAKTGLMPFFSAVVSGDTLPWKKPDPRPVLRACEELGKAPDEVLFVGDSVHDVQAGRAAGCAVWCVPYGYNEGRPITEARCDRVVSGLEEVAERLLETGSGTSAQ